MIMEAPTNTKDYSAQIYANCTTMETLYKTVTKESNGKTCASDFPEDTIKIIWILFEETLGLLSEPNTSQALTERTFELKVFGLGTDHIIYQIFAKTSKEEEIRLRSNRLIFQLSELKTAQGKLFDIIFQDAAENADAIFDYCYIDPTGQGQNLYSLEQAISQADIPREKKNYLHNSLLKGVHKLFVRYDKINKLYEEATSDFSDHNQFQEEFQLTFNELFDVLKFLFVRGSIFTYRELLEKTASLKLFAEQEDRFLRFFLEKNELDFAVARFKVQLADFEKKTSIEKTNYWVCDDLYNIISLNISRLYARYVDDKLSQDLWDEIVKLVNGLKIDPKIKNQLVVLFSNDYVEKAIGKFLDELGLFNDVGASIIVLNKDKLSEHHRFKGRLNSEEGPDTKGILNDFKEFAQSYNDLTLTDFNWKKICNGLFASVITDDCYQELMKACTSISPNLALSFVVIRWSFNKNKKASLEDSSSGIVIRQEKENDKNTPGAESKIDPSTAKFYEITAPLLENHTQKDSVSTSLYLFESLAKKFKSKTIDEPRWKELCKSFFETLVDFKHVEGVFEKIYSVSKDIGKDFLIAYLEFYYQAISNKTVYAVNLELGLDRINGCLEYLSKNESVNFDIFNPQNIWVSIFSNIYNSMNTNDKIIEFCKSIKSVDRSPQKLISSLLIFDLHLIKLKKLLEGRQDYSYNEFFPTFLNELKVLSEIYKDRKLGIEAWTAITTKVTDLSKDIPIEHYQELKKVIIESPQNELTSYPMVNSVTSLVSSISNAVWHPWATLSSAFSQLLVDGDKDWKKEKYSQVIGFISTKVKSIQGKIDVWLNDEKNPPELKIEVESLLTMIKQDLPPTITTGELRIHHRNIIKKTREIISNPLFIDNQNNTFTLGPAYTNGCAHIIIELCEIRFGEVIIYKYLKQLVSSMVSVGLQEIAKTDPRAKLHLNEPNLLLLPPEIQHGAIKAAPQEHKAPLAALGMERLKSVTGVNYDPHGHNLPFKLYNLFYPDGRSVNVIRIGNPTINGAEIDPIFAVFAKNNKRRTLYNNLQTNAGAQGVRSEAIYKFSRENPDKFFAVGMCPNTPFARQEKEFADKYKEIPLYPALKEFKLSMLDVVLDRDRNYYYFPDHWYSDPFFKEKVAELWNTTYEMCFQDKRDFKALNKLSGQDKINKLNEEIEAKKGILQTDRTIFIMMFNILLLDYLIERVKADTLFKICNHGADRLGLIVTIFLKFMYIVFDKKGERYEEFLNVHIQAASILANKQGMNHNFRILLDAWKRLEDPDLRKRIVEMRNRFYVKDIHMPFEENLNEQIFSDDEKVPILSENEEIF